MNRISRILIGAFATFASLSSAHSAERPHHTIRVLTLNIFAGTHGEMDYERLARQIRGVQALNPHVVCLQEVFEHRAREEYIKAFQHHHLFGHDQDTPLIFGHESVWKSILSIGAEVTSWYTGSEFLDGYWTDTSVLLDNRRGQSIPQSKESAFLSFGAPDEGHDGLTLKMIHWLESVKPKSFLRVDYEVEGTPITVANMRLSNGVHNPHRMRQIREVVERVSQNNPNPIILCGDTNADGNEPEMKWVREWAGFTDTFLEASPYEDEATQFLKGKTWSSYNNLAKEGNLSEPDQRVDFIMYAPGRDYTFKTVSSRLVLTTSPFVSDHFGVLSELQLVPIER